MPCIAVIFCVPDLNLNLGFKTYGFWWRARI
jgi:hypothetical protein